MIKLTLKLVKEHRVVAEYAEVDENNVKLTRPTIQPIYIRKSDMKGMKDLPLAFDLTLTPIL